MGHAICYRRSAVREVGGWAVEGYSRQAHREESDLCARLFVHGHRLLVTTAALAWHLYAPGGGSREVRKTTQGNFLVSDRSLIEQDERLFKERLETLKAHLPPPRRASGRFRLSDLEKGHYKRRPLITVRSRVLRTVERTLLRPARRLGRYFANPPARG
jgi:hypothetical protein